MMSQLRMLGLVLLLTGCHHEAGTIGDYEEARRIFWQSLYSGPGQTLYCAADFSRTDRQGINIEHVFPMSWVKNAMACGTRQQCRKRSPIFNQIEANLHNLYPSRSDVNQRRSSFRFGEVAGEARRFGSHCDFEVNDRLRVAEPAPQVRGNVARAMFYMAHRYREDGLRIFRKHGELLLKWHLADPPDDRERARNERIGHLQGDRNPFIDNPGQLAEWAEQGYFY